MSVAVFFEEKLLRLFFLGIFLLGFQAQAAEKLVITVLGDSLTSGFELRTNEGYVPVLEKQLLSKGYNVDLRSASVAGQSMRQGRDWVFVEPVISADIVLLQLGGNDGAYRVLPEEIQENLDYMITNMQGRGQMVVLLGMKMSPKYGLDYRMEYDAVFETTAAKYNLMFEPFIYAPLFDFDTLDVRRELLLDDARHPNAEGVRRLVEHTQALVEKAIRKRRAN